MHQAAARIGRSWEEIRAAARAGAPAFKASRVNVTALREWFAQQEEVGTPAKDPEADERRDLTEEVEHVERILAQVDRTAQRLIDGGQLEMASVYLDRADKLATRRNAALVQLRREGRTENDSIPRPEMERIAHALAYNAALGLQRMADDLADKLRGVTDPAGIRDILTRGLVASAYLAPFDQAVELDAGHGLPHWVVEAMTKAPREMVE